MGREAVKEEIREIAKAAGWTEHELTNYLIEFIITQSAWEKSRDYLNSMAATELEMGETTKSYDLDLWSDPAWDAIRKGLADLYVDCEHPPHLLTEGPRVPMSYGTSPTDLCSCGWYRTKLHVLGKWQEGPPKTEADYDDF